MRAQFEKFTFAFLLLSLNCGVASATEGPRPVSAVVRALDGKCEISNDEGSKFQAAELNMKLGPGTLIRTGQGSTMDLFLGDNGPVMRLNEKTLLLFNRLSSETLGVEKIIETEIELRAGEILGTVKKLAPASRYVVKFPCGIASVKGTQYKVKANGSVGVIIGRIEVQYELGQTQLLPVFVESGQYVVCPKTAHEQPVIRQIVPASITPTGHPLARDRGQATSLHFIFVIGHS